MFVVLRSYLADLEANIAYFTITLLILKSVVTEGTAIQTDDRSLASQTVNQVTKVSFLHTW